MGEREKEEKKGIVEAVELEPSFTGFLGVTAGEMSGGPTQILGPVEGMSRGTHSSWEKCLESISNLIIEISLAITAFCASESFGGG